MDYFESLDQIPAGFGPSAVTFGKFDGMHIGHQRVIGALREIANARGLVSTVLTFDRNPLSLLDPARCPESLVGNAQKRALIERTGVDALVQLAFDRAFSSMAAEEFVERIIVGALGARVLLVGPGTRFGSRGAGNFDLLVRLGATHGFEVVQLDLLTEDDEPVSSTRIRRLLSEGRVAEAGRLLGRYPVVRSSVVRGQQRGRALGYPTANLAPGADGFIPADGVYAGRLTVDGRTMPAAISIGNNPTFDGVPERQVEAHVIDEDLDLYDKIVDVEFVQYLRGMVKFDGLNELVDQMRLDTDQARELVAALDRA